MRLRSSLPNIKYNHIILACVPWGVISQFIIKGKLNLPPTTINFKCRGNQVSLQTTNRDGRHLQTDVTLKYTFLS